MTDNSLNLNAKIDVDDGDILTGYSSAPFELEELEAMLRDDPENEMLLDIAAFKYYTSGAIERALRSYQTLVKLNYKKPLYHFYLANTYYKLKRFVEALAEWEATKALDPHGPYGKKSEQRVKMLKPGSA